MQGMCSGEAKKTHGGIRARVAARLLKSAVPIARSKSMPMGAGLVCVGMRVGKYREGLGIGGPRSGRERADYRLPDRPPNVRWFTFFQPRGFFSQRTPNTF